MPALASTHPISYPVARPTGDRRDEKTGQGRELQFLIRTADDIVAEAAAVGQGRAAAFFRRLLVDGPTVDDETDGCYESPPPKRTVTTRVRYQYIGRGKPQPYPLDDDA